MLSNCLDSLILSQFSSQKDLPPDTPKPNVCIPILAPVEHTSIPDEFTPGAYAEGGADLILLFVVLLVVELELDPDSYVVDEVYPPSIAVLDPLTFDWVLPAYADVVNSNINNIVRVLILCIFFF